MCMSLFVSDACVYAQEDLKGIGSHEAIVRASYDSPNIRDRDTSL